MLDTDGDLSIVNGDYGKRVKETIADHVPDVVVGDPLMDFTPDDRVGDGANNGSTLLPASMRRRRKKSDNNSEQFEFDLSKGRELRDEGIEKVLSTEETEEWKTAFKNARDSLIDGGGRFTAEDVRAICGNPPIHAHPNIFSAMTNTISRMANHVDWTQSKRPTSHAAALKVYQGRKQLGDDDNDHMGGKLTPKPPEMPVVTLDVKNVTIFSA